MDSAKTKEKLRTTAEAYPLFSNLCQDAVATIESLEAEVKAQEVQAEKGYAEAYELITELRNLLNDVTTERNELLVERQELWDKLRRRLDDFDAREYTGT